MYWWPGMKRDVEKYVENCLTCLKVKTNHQKPGGVVQLLHIPMRKQGEMTMDFVKNYYEPQDDMTPFKLWSIT